jgi:hypothetical protein
VGYFIERIPKIMRSKGWFEGQRLMETWFSRPAAIAPHYSPPVTIKMDWVLGFERAKNVYDELVADQIWQNGPAQNEIAKMLKRKGLLLDSPAAKTFGNLSQAVPLLDTDYINFRAVDAHYYYDFYGSYYGWSVDDLKAALGAFVFRVVTAGKVARVQESDPDGIDPGYDVTIEEVGVYVRDSFDFEGHQFLGFWDDDGVNILPSSAGSHSVSNGNFRDWRDDTGKGGDFLVYSDLKRIALRPPVTFNIDDPSRATEDAISYQ